MIGRLTGTLLEKKPPMVLVDVGGVGYEVFAPMTTLYNLPETGSTVTLLTHFVVREDAQLLYGFLNEVDRQLFRDLIKVNGVGPRTGLAILSGMEAKTLVVCIQNGDTAMLSKIPGIGKKTSERLVIEMRDRIKGWDKTMSSISPIALGVSANEAHLGNAQSDAVSALVALGYKLAEATKMVAPFIDAGHQSEVLIKMALQKKVARP
jgi:Holliday junction DNA helicase RuvA